MLLPERQLVDDAMELPGVLDVELAVRGSWRNPSRAPFIAGTRREPSTVLLAALVALSNSLKEVLLVGFIVLVPTVPVTLFAWNFVSSRSRRGVGEEREIEAGRSPATPFAMISIVGSVIAVAAIAVLLLVVAVRAVAA